MMRPDARGGTAERGAVGGGGRTDMGFGGAASGGGAPRGEAFCKRHLPSPTLTSEQDEFFFFFSFSSRDDGFVWFVYHGAIGLVPGSEVSLQAFHSLWML